MFTMNDNIKINIFYNFTDKPWGGGNQFLKALKNEFLKMEIYEDDFRKAGVILFNSHNNLESCLEIKRKFPDKIIIHRIDGPMFLYRGSSKELDRIIFLFGDIFVDGVIFQSEWAKQTNRKYFKSSVKYETVIHNASDGRIFNKNNKRRFGVSQKISLIAASWSSNWRKGFDIYKFLDENLDFSRYEMTFVGNAPLEFKNIRSINPVSSEELAEILKQHDIFITASRNDPCSNALIEALSCGLLIVSLNEGGHSELIGKGGELFNGKDDIIKIINKVSQDPGHYLLNLPRYSIRTAAKQYCDFIKNIHIAIRKGKYVPRKVSFFECIKFCKIWLIFLKIRLQNKIGNLFLL